MVEQLERRDLATQQLLAKEPTDERPPVDPCISPPWWLKWPTLIINEKLHVVGRGKETNHVEAGKVFTSARPMLQTIAREFERAGCTTITAYEDHEVKENNEVRKVIEGTHHNPAYTVTINPVYLGPLPQKVEAALVNYRLRPSNRHLLKTLKDHLPEETDPMVTGVGTRLRNLVARFRRKPDPDKPSQDEQQLLLQKHDEGKNFVNMVFIRDDKGVIATTPDCAMQLFDWALMVKQGSFKTIVAAYAIQNNEVIFSNPILATLEGGHPKLDTIGLAQHLMVLGSTKGVGNAAEIEDAEPISYKLWKNLSAVKGLKDFGKFLGKKGLLSPPLALHQFAKSESLRQKLQDYIKYSRQAEGAFWAWDPNKKMVESISHLIRSPLTGIAIVTSSGRFGTIKSKLRLKDLVSSIPANVLGVMEASKVLYLRVEGLSLRKPSVEAEEFTYPVYELAEEDPQKYTIKLKAVKGGYIASEDGDLINPIVKGVGHLHDEMSIKDGKVVEAELTEGDVIVNEKSGIFEVPTDEFPAFGCGVDQMQEMSRRVMKLAIDIWIKRDRKDKAAIFYVPNHGYNVLTFWAAEQNGIIPAHQFSQLEELIESGALKVTKGGVHQRNYYRPLDDYYARQTA